jgi:uncharacterized phage-associated protein
MIKADFYTHNQIEKLGNALIFLCEKRKQAGESVSKTHLLKLIFIIEEISVRKYGIPFFDLRFDVWKLGPVSKDLFYELTEEPTMLAEYIELDKENKLVKPKRSFSDDEFSDIEMNLLEEISDRFLYCTAAELVNHTHRKHSPWHNTALKNGVLDLLETGAIPPITDIEIDLSECLEGDPLRLALYTAHKEFLAQSKSLQS